MERKVGEGGRRGRGRKEEGRGRRGREEGEGGGGGEEWEAAVHKLLLHIHKRWFTYSPRSQQDL